MPSTHNQAIARQIQEWLEDHYDNVQPDDGKIIFNAFILPLSNDLRGDIRRLQNKLIEYQEQDDGASTKRERMIKSLAQKIESHSTTLLNLLGGPE